MPAQTTVIYEATGQPIAELHGAINRVDRARLAAPAVAEGGHGRRRGQALLLRLPRHRLPASRGRRSPTCGRPRRSGRQHDHRAVRQERLPGGQDDSFTRKVHEAILAWELSDRWSKDHILTAYLNTVYYGDGAYGVQAAARTYFHENVRAALAGAGRAAGRPAPGPSGYSPIYDPAEALARRNLVLADMAAQGYISARPSGARQRGGLRVYATAPPGRAARAAYFVDYVEDQLVARFGATEAFDGGLRVHTTLDLRLQKRRSRGDEGACYPAGPAGALVSIDPATGYIRAMVTSLDFAHEQFNLASQAHRQLGSAMKPFALAAAVEQGVDPSTTYYSSQPLTIPLGPSASPGVMHLRQTGRLQQLVQATWPPTTPSMPASPWTSGRRTRAGRPRHGHHEPAGAVSLDHAGDLGRHPAGDGRRLRHFRRRGIHHAPQAIRSV